MDDTTFFKKLTPETAGGLWIFHGTERYTLHEAVRRCLLLPDEAMREMNTAVLTAPAETELRAAAEALPFFDSLRVVVAEKVDADTAQKLAGDPKSVPPSTMLVLVFYSKLKANSSLLKAVKDSGHEVLFEPRDRLGAERFLEGLLRREGVSFGPGAKSELLDRTDTDLAAIDSYVRLLSSVHPDGAPVTAADIRLYVPERDESRAWDLLGLFLKGDLSGGIACYQRMLREDPGADFMILGYLEKRCAQMLEVKTLLAEKRTEREIGEILGIKGGALSHLIGDTRRTDSATLKRAVRAFAMTDANIKSGTRSQRDALFTALYEAFLPAAKGGERR